MKRKALWIALSTLLATGAVQAATDSGGPHRGLSDQQVFDIFSEGTYGAPTAAHRVDLAALEVASSGPRSGLSNEEIFAIFSEGTYGAPTRQVDIAALEVGGHGGTAVSVPHFDLIDLNY